MCEKGYILRPATSTCEGVKYLESITGNSLTISDEIKEVTKFFQHVLAKNGNL